MKKYAKENFEKNLDDVILENTSNPKMTEDVLENNANAYKK